MALEIESRSPTCQVSTLPPESYIPFPVWSHSAHTDLRSVLLDLPVLCHTLGSWRWAGRRRPLPSQYLQVGCYQTWVESESFYELSFFFVFPVTHPVRICDMNLNNALRSVPLHFLWPLDIQPGQQLEVPSACSTWICFSEQDFRMSWQGLFPSQVLEHHCGSAPGPLPFLTLYYHCLYISLISTPRL